MRLFRQFFLWPSKQIFHNEVLFCSSRSPSLRFCTSLEKTCGECKKLSKNCVFPLILLTFTANLIRDVFGPKQKNGWDKTFFFLAQTEMRLWIQRQIKYSFCNGNFPQCLFWYLPYTHKVGNWAPKVHLFMLGFS